MTRPSTAPASLPLPGAGAPGPAAHRAMAGWLAAALQAVRWPMASAGEDAFRPGMSARERRIRKVILLAFMGYFLLAPAVSGVVRQATPRTIFMLAGAIAFALLIAGFFAYSPLPGSQRVPWWWLALTVGLAIGLFETAGQDASWLAVLALAAAACGRFTISIWPAAFGAATTVTAGLVSGVAYHYNQGTIVAVCLLPPMAAFFAYTAGKRNETVATLRQTRAELAQVAVAGERLRIARDLHDLLGHSLSLITLKAELSQRVIDTDPERAAREMAELETVARKSLSDVREAVAGYRQPDLAAELGAARQLLTAAGIACQITAPDELSLPGEVDAVTAWTIREGITNVVRHARATSTAITVITGHDIVTAEIVDNGTGCVVASAPPGSAPPGSAPPGSAPPGSAPPGSGLAGLGERVRALGGDLVAECLQPRGFRLRATIPTSGRGASAAVSAS
jgi:two-component system, NarL family, sensor histidine kinase DesK